MGNTLDSDDGFLVAYYVEYSILGVLFENDAATGAPRPVSRCFGTHDFANAKQETNAWLRFGSAYKKCCSELLQIEEGSLYPALQRMLKVGWLESEMGISARNRPVRIFKLTKAGAKHLAQELASFERMFAGINRVLAIASS